MYLPVFFEDPPAAPLPFVILRRRNYKWGVQGTVGSHVPARCLVLKKVDKDVKD
jgi:hypothetical protein